jgi:hypothetical protein
MVETHPEVSLKKQRFKPVILKEIQNKGEVYVSLFGGFGSGVGVANPRRAHAPLLARLSTKGLRGAPNVVPAKLA